MGSEIFNLKSLYLEDTVVRGGRISTKNAPTTRSIEVNPGDDPTVKTGETGVNKEYLIQASLIGNDLNGYGTFINNSEIIRGYTGAQNLFHGDKIKLDGERSSCTITGLQGTDVYLIEKYTKENISDPDSKSGACSIEKISLDSVKIEKADTNIIYNKDKSEWGVTGIQMSDPQIVPSDSFELDTGLTLKFQKGTSKNKPDIATVLSTYKTLVGNSTSPVSDISLSPIPYPHSSLQVLIGKNGEELKKAVEAVDYVVNYSNGSEVLYPIPPYEERDVAYIKLLGKMTDETQVNTIDSSFNGTAVISKTTQEGAIAVTRPVQEILPTNEFVIKVNGSEKVKNTDYLVNNAAGILTFVEHSNRESLIDTLTYPKKLIWDGISVIKSVREDAVNDFANLVVPGVSGIKGIDYTLYFEDTDSNNLVRDVDFIIDPESGAFALTNPTKEDEAVLVSYYVEGNDIKNEKVEVNNLRLNSYPLIVSSLILTKKYSTLSDAGAVVSQNRILVEGIDFTVSYVTGYIQLFSSNEITLELIASYTPMAQINCVSQSIPGSSDYTYTILDDVLTFSQNDIGSKALIFKINNPSVSVPKKILFESDKVDSNYTFSGSILPENILDIRAKGTDIILNVNNAKYDEIKKEIILDSSLNGTIPQDYDIVVGSYTYQSDILPYAPVLLIYTIINAGDSSFLIEGYDKTDTLKAGIVLRVDNKDPQSTNYYVIREVTYQNQSTNVDIYGTFPETAIDPIFSVFDDLINWQGMSEDVQVDTSVPIDSGSILLDGGALFVRTNIKKDSLLIVNSQEIYTITSVSTQGSISEIGIYPNLRFALSSDVKFSRLPIYDVGITALPAKRLILDDMSQPAFTLWYNAPDGFEGSAKVLFIKNKIILDEYISGVKNPVSYEFLIENYQDIYALAKAIQATVSTYKSNLPYMGVPDYNPFSIVNSGKEEYYLGNGTWDPSTLIPFEEEVFVNLPQTLNVIPELTKFSLLEVFSGKNEFIVKNSDVTTKFTSGMVAAFLNKISGRYFFSKVIKSEFIADKGTVIELSSPVSENMIAPKLFVCSKQDWVPLNQSLSEIDYIESKFKFSGILDQNIRVGTLLSIADSAIYQVTGVLQNNNGFEITLNPAIDRDIKVQTYTGYINVSSVPVPLSDPGPQPHIQFMYAAPKAHVGYASIIVTINQITIKETVDNFKTKETTFNFSDYENYGLLFDAIKNLESYVSGDRPYSIDFDNNFVDVLTDTFDKYALKSSTNQLPCSVGLAVSAFDINYQLPPEYGIGSGPCVRITAEYIAIKEVVIDLHSNDLEKETIIYYSSTANLSDLVNRVIPGISSVVSPSIFPYTTVLNNESTFGLGLWGGVHLTSLLDEYVNGDQEIYATIDANAFTPQGNLNEKKMVLDTDYTIDNGAIGLVKPLESLERFYFNYMGLDNLYENEGDSITCSCRFLAALPVGYRLDVYLEYINTDQFYIQKLTERKFTEIVTVPQIETIVEQKGSSGGQGNDSGATNDMVLNHNGGIADMSYLLQDEYIKKQLYIRIFNWYKQRLRGLSAELQLGLGFKFGHSNAVGDSDGYYTLDDQMVETEDYTMTKVEDLKQIDNGFSKYFPIGYSGQAPENYHRFGKEYLSFNEVYCCNITYKDDKNKVVTVGVVKSDRPYWNRASDLNFKVWEDAYINKTLVGFYSVDVLESDRSFTPNNYTFLRVVDIGDKIKVEGFKNPYTISDIVAPVNKTYEYILTSSPFSDKGIKTYNIIGKQVQVTADPDSYTALTVDMFVDAISPDGYRISIIRQDKEAFPMFDDYGSLGASAYGDAIEKLANNNRRIKKPFGAALLKLFFPFIKESTKNFKVMVKKDSEGPWEELGSVDLSKLTFKEERNIDDVMDALRYDFTEKFKIPMPPPAPPIVIYDIKEDSDKGFFRYFYLSLENIYNAESKDGYYQGIVIRAKDRNWCFKFVDGGEENIIGDYGYNEEKVYENFYDPENIYKNLLLEKQAWQTEELIIRDLYDYSDKIARAFDQGDLNRKNSRYQNYLAMPDGGTIKGISEILRSKIPAYEKQLRFMTDTQGPVFRTLYPDLVHAEDSASPEIALTYNQTLYAWNLYQKFYDRMRFYGNLNEDNNNVWKNDYIKWVLSLERGILYQRAVKQMYESHTGAITVGLIETPTIKVVLAPQTLYTVINPRVTVSSDYGGKYFEIVYDLISTDISNQKISGVVCLIYLYKKSTLNSVPTIVYKSIPEVCSDITAYAYNGVNLFLATDVFEHFENDIVSKIIGVNNSLIDPVEGIQLNSANVADHRASDPRILFLNKKIEDRIYTHEIRELPGINLSYFGGYYLLKYGIPGLSISLADYTGKTNLKYGVFFDHAGEKVLTLTYDFNGVPKYSTFQLYVSGSTSYIYKSVSQLSYEINNSNFFKSTVLSSGSIACDSFIITSDYVPAGNFAAVPYLTTVSAYNSAGRGTNQFYYRVYTDSAAVRKLDIVFYNLLVDGKNVYKDSTISDTFTFSFQRLDGTFKTLSEICKEITSFSYRGEKIFSASAVYEPIPKSDLSASAILINSTLTPVGFDWLATVYVDTYVEAISGKDANSRTISNIKNAVFSFPMYTANGNSNKIAIEDIPVAGVWDTAGGGEVIEIGCLDGTNWGVSFSDYDSGDFKSYMAPQELVSLIDSGKALTEEQYAKIKVTEDMPLVTVIKELILTRQSGLEESFIRFNLRQYSTINELVSAITATKFNDLGIQDTNGDRPFFIAKLIGDPNVQGKYKCYELDTEYTPIIKSFKVIMGDGTTVHKDNLLIGWKLTSISLPTSLKHRISMSPKRYSYGQEYKFTLKGPEETYKDTLSHNPQGFKRDILAFELYSWDYNAKYEIQDNWIYFKSSSVDYLAAGDLGQPNKLLGYGIPLAGSGHVLAPHRERLIDLINRINTNAVVNNWFYADLKFTREDRNNPGYFEYNYLPNFYLNIPRSSLDNIKLKDDFLMDVRPGSGYSFSASNITIDGALDTLSLSCAWSFNYEYERTFFFNDLHNNTLGGLGDAVTGSINNALAPEILTSLVKAEVLSGLSNIVSKSLIPTFVTKSLNSTGTDIAVNVGTITTPALRLSIRNATGSNYAVNNATFSIPNTRDRIVIKCSLTYRSVYTLSNYFIGAQTVGLLSSFISSIKPYPDNIFKPLFRSSVLSSSFVGYSSSRLKSVNSSVPVAGVSLIARLNDITAFKVLNMSSEGNVVVSESTLALTTFKKYSKELPSDKDVSKLVDSIKGSFVDGFLSCGVLTLKVPSIETGALDATSYTLASNNTPAHVYFGILGDIKFIQVSDQNLHVQYNYIKERLGMPWADSQGKLKQDYYTPENYNENNPCAIDLSNFLGYLRTGRYNQIKNSIVNEAIVSNKYLWLYMKFHKEFGCDQRAKMLKDAIQKGNLDIETLGQAL